MRFLADECCDVENVKGLRDDGHNVLSALESFRSSPDPSILDAANQDGRVVLTEDRDFGELLIRFEAPAVGVVYLRLDPATGDRKLARVREVLHEFENQLMGSIIGIEPDRVRVRALPPVP